MSWRVAKSLDKLRSQVNAARPNRSKLSDGTIGDAKHASRSSDHNPWIKDGPLGVVSALDITHDPNGGVDSYKLAEALVQSRDDRIKYIISNGRIISGTDGPQPWVWRKYTGSNAHTKHVHISVKSSKDFYDDTRPWSLGAALGGRGSALGDKEIIEKVQRDLVKLGYFEVGEADGLMGGRTRGGITAFMNDRNEAPTNSITQNLVLEIARAKEEGWSRPIPATRAMATPKDIAPKVEAVKQNALTRLWSKILTIPSVVGGAVWGAVTNIPDANTVASPYISVAKEYVGSVPGWVWLLLVAIIGFIIWRSTNKSDDATVSDYQSGRLI